MVVSDNSRLLVKIIKRLYSSKRKEVERYLERQASDQYSKRAKEHAYRARSAFKLLQINEKFRFIKPGLVALDIGAAPGSWCQVLQQLIFPNEFESNYDLPDKFSSRRSAKTKKSTHNECTTGQLDDGYILGVDLLQIAPIDDVDLLCGADITKPATQKEIRRRLNGRKVDLLLSDMAPNPTGDSQTDHLRIVQLCHSVIQFGTTTNHIIEDEPLLVENGTFLCKIFDGIYKNDLLSDLKAKFQTVKVTKPDASRYSSSETYIYAAGFIGNTVNTNTNIVDKKNGRIRKH